ncbi:PaaI family thioesterase [Catenuloplanes sp. NPDC051500]|uniref:PaaI family thioesterase n=1 Tax=Catenuloplanes sp. NPDC051500 TaxID=3363959 RepID=UPI0037AE7034
MEEISRSRTYTWSDPASVAAHLGRLSGLEMLRAMSAGELPAPPIFSTIGFGDLEAKDGWVGLDLDPREFHYNPLGSVHGGVISTLLDTAAACAVHTTLPAGVGYTSLDLNVKFVRPVTIATGRVRCEGTVLNRGRRTALAESRLTDGAGKLLAHATSSCLIFDMPG